METRGAFSISTMVQDINIFIQYVGSILTESQHSITFNKSFQERNCFSELQNYIPQLVRIGCFNRAETWWLNPDLLNGRTIFLTTWPPCHELSSLPLWINWHKTLKRMIKNNQTVTSTARHVLNQDLREPFYFVCQYQLLPVTSFCWMKVKYFTKRKMENLYL